MTKIKTDKILAKIGRLADDKGYEIYVVGGFVRDRLMENEVKDLDFTVINGGMNCARDVAAMLGVKKVVAFEKFGTAMIPYKDYNLEFVQARSEKYDKDSRKPMVETGDLQTDLARRDFTINTLAQRLSADCAGEIIDRFGGIADLDNKILRTPLDPITTYDDDPLRMIRAIRFASRFNFTIEEKSLKAIKQLAPRISIVSQERVTDEFTKIMLTNKPSVGLDLLRETGFLKPLFPDLFKLIGTDQIGKHHHKDVWFHTIQVVDNISRVTDKLELRLAALLHDIAKPQTKKFVETVGWTFHGHEVLGAKMVLRIIKQLKLPTDMISYLQKLISLHLRPIHLSSEEVTVSAIRRLIVNAGNELEDLMMLCRADITSGNPRRVQQHLANFDLVEERINEVEGIDELRAFRSPVDGNEIMTVLELTPSPLIGRIKHQIEEAIIECEIENEHDPAFEYMMQIKDGIIAEYEAEISQKNTKN